MRRWPRSKHAVGAQKFIGAGKKVVGVGIAIADRNVADWAAITLVAPT